MIIELVHFCIIFCHFRSDSSLTLDTVDKNISQYRT